MEVERVMFTKNEVIITFSDGTKNEVAQENDLTKILKELEIEVLQ